VDVDVGVGADVGVDVDVEEGGKGVVVMAGAFLVVDIVAVSVGGGDIRSSSRRCDGA